MIDAETSWFALACLIVLLFWAEQRIWQKLYKERSARIEAAIMALGELGVRDD